MGDLVVGLAKTVVVGVIAKTQEAKEKDTKLRRSIQRDLVFIAGEFEMIGSFLNVADEERDKNKVVMTWVRQIREVADDVEDCIEFVLSLDMKKTTWWRHLFSACIEAAAAPLDEAVAEIEQLKARVEDVNRRNKRYNLIGDYSSSKAVAMDQLLPGGAPATVDTIVPPNKPEEFSMLIEARDATSRLPQSDQLTRLLTTEHDDLQVISLWGTAGDFGMMSLIREAYSCPEIRQSFTARAWVRFVNPFNPHEFIQRFMEQFYANSCNEQGPTVGSQVLSKMQTSKDDLLSAFEEIVAKQRYLLVLEDLCAMVAWDALRTFFPSTGNRSRIIVSTQKCEYASLCVGHPYQVMELRKFSAHHSVHAFFREGSEDVNARHVLRRFLFLSKMKEAEKWMLNFVLTGRKSEMTHLHRIIVLAHFFSFQVMSVWGISGIGKSALVKNLFCDRISNRNVLFEKYGWVNISHPFNLMDFSQSLLLNLLSGSLEAKETAWRHDPIKSKNSIIECLKILKRDKCLVVVDGLQSRKDWDLIRAELVSKSHRKTLFIVITTEASMATHCIGGKQGSIFNVKGLEDDAAFDLFTKQVSIQLPSGRKEMELRELISKCGGIPKLIIAIADLLKSKASTLMDTARSINDRFMQHLQTDPEFDSLQSVFRHMHSLLRACPDFLKPCIFYISIFPRDYIIRRRRLVRRWIAEGYSRDNSDGHAEQNGEIFFSELLGMNIVQQSPQVVTNSVMALCQVDGFYREYIVSRRMEENLVCELRGSCTTVTTQRTARHLVITESWDRDMIVFQNIDFSRLRSMTVFGNWKPFFISESMKQFRVLDLEDASGVTDPDLEQMVKMLPRLRFLSLRGCIRISNLPDSLGDLRQLQTLDVRRTSAHAIPASIRKLHKLQYFRTSVVEPSGDHLSLSPKRDTHVGTRMRRGIGTLTALRTLGDVNITVSGVKGILEELKKLTQLRKLGVSGINKNNSKKFLSALSVHVHLESLSVRLDKDNQDCLDGIALHLESLRSVKLYSLGKKLPEWVNQLSKLGKLVLEMAKLKKQGMRLLGKLPELCILRLRVKQIEDGEIRFPVTTNGQEEFSNVKILEFSCCSSMDVTFGSEAMRKLEVLEIDCCCGSPYQFYGLENLSELKQVLLKGSYDETLMDDLQRQLKNHEKLPLLKMPVENPRSS